MVSACRTTVFFHVVHLDDHTPRWLTPTLMQLFSEGGPRSVDDRGDGLYANVPCRDLCGYLTVRGVGLSCETGIRSHTPSIRCAVGVWTYATCNVGASFVAGLECDRGLPGDSSNRGSLFPLKPPCEVTSCARVMCHMDEWAASSVARRDVGPCPTTVATQRIVHLPQDCGTLCSGARSVQERREQVAKFRLTCARTDCTHI